MPKTKQPKRVNGYLSVLPDGYLTDIQPKPLKPFPPGRCIRVVELRRGEVVVDVEALMLEFQRQAVPAEKLVAAFMSEQPVVVAVAVAVAVIQPVRGAHKWQT